MKLKYKRFLKDHPKLAISLTALLIVLSVALIILPKLFGNTDGHIPKASLDNIPAFDGKTPYVIINDNKPFFKENEIVSESYEEYGELDGLGRCTVAVACIGVDLMPTEDRESISQVTPSGWINAKYDFIDGGYVYNRCHLIGFQLTGENANRENLITGTRFLNIEGMLPFENLVADYLKEHPKNHVMFRSTPIYDGDNLVASGVLLEGWSVEDNGSGICFNVYAYNAQPGVIIDYDTGETHPAE